MVDTDGVNATFVAMAAESPAIVEASAHDDGQVKRRRKRRGISLIAAAADVAPALVLHAHNNESHPPADLSSFPPAREK
jgi:hypothetical protein